MADKQSLSAALQKQAGRVTAERVIAEQEKPSVPSLPPSRQGKKTIAGHFDPAVSRQLREIALAEDSSVQDLLREALNDLFAKRGRPPIA
jgi:predicted HicB family RNase H-like nuclease